MHKPCKIMQPVLYSSLTEDSIIWHLANLKHNLNADLGTVLGRCGLCSRDSAISSSRWPLQTPLLKIVSSSSGCPGKRQAAQRCIGEDLLDGDKRAAGHITALGRGGGRHVLAYSMPDYEHYMSLCKAWRWNISTWLWIFIVYQVCVTAVFSTCFSNIGSFYKWVE